jgi:hypothetical protein
MSDALLSRRGLLGLALAARITPMRASDSDFWNKKQPADWTPEEIDRLLRDSPWAKEITPTYSSLPLATDRRVWSENPSIGGGSLPPSPVPGGPAPRSLKVPYRAIIRWDSAEPIRSAQRVALPAAFRGRYVLSVLLNNAKDLGSRASEDLKHSAVLVGTRAVDAEIVQVHPATKYGFLIAFPKNVTPADGHLEFSARAGRLALKAKFNTSDMRYHGQLAL